MVKANIKTITPVHIGTGRFLMAETEFVRDGTRIAIIDEKKVLNIIGKENIHQWIDIIEKGEGLLDFIRARKSGLKIDDIALRSMDLAADKIHNIKRILINSLSQK